MKDCSTDGRIFFTNKPALSEAEREERKEFATEAPRATEKVRSEK